ncbi:MAG: hypothetical protein QXD48_01690 [Candidatus Aenigmatarchaeota archaeon]
MIFTFILLIIGLVLLIKFSDLTIKNCVKFSKLIGISQIVIGFIFIAVATSLPELAIAIMSSIRGEGILSFGNLVGANVSNITLIFGILALFGFAINKKEFPEIVDAITLTTIIAFFLLFLNVVDAVFGIFSLILFFAFSNLVMKSGIKIKNYSKGIKIIKIVESISLILISIAFVIVGAHLTTDSAIKISEFFGVSETIIGASILSIGTTLPELSIGIAAIRKGNVDLAVGDSIGSIVTNLTLILGIVVLIRPISFNYVSNILLISLILINMIFLILASRMKFDKKEGIILLIIYTIYLFIIFMPLF